ncbi:MAG: hypothetical protein JRI23_03430 [Deltaproteobacteria bacterium]|jgi:alpha-tubulin suppressor-like RCC1 family protein|nr:hypothetical protein [Deltaproteobacteria bacterium]MBW2530562.1 hypothetical protein [Deltaproteobacteria bacterium]
MSCAARSPLGSLALVAAGALGATGCTAINGLDGLEKVDCLGGDCSAVTAVDLVRPMGAARHMSCGGTLTDEVACWGTNLPDEAHDVALAPTIMPAMAGADRISVGLGHGCIVVENQVSCWGQNDYGQLGDGTFLASRLPVPVLGPGGTGTLDNAKRITRGDHHSCVQTTDNEAVCWGANDHGQLGTGDTYDSPHPVTVPLPGQINKISGGSRFTCAVLTDNRVFCWGQNHRGQCGQPASALPVLTPTEVVGVAAEKVVGGGQFACAHTVAGDAMCWGAGTEGQLGNDAAQDSDTPVPVADLSGIEGVSPGDRHACAQLPEGTLCWGANDHGQLGNDEVGERSLVPVVPTANDFDGTQTTNLYTGGEHVCVTYAPDGRIYCWGLNDSGQLGIGTLGGTAGPTPVGG